MRLVHLALASTLLVASSTTFAYKTVEKICPPASALHHTAIGQPWTLDAPYNAQGWYVVQDSNQDPLTTFSGGRVGGVSVYLKDDGISGPAATCAYESGDEAKVFIKSVYPAVPNAQSARFYWNKKLQAYECDQGGFDQNGNVYGDPKACKWPAADFSQAN